MAYVDYSTFVLCSIVQPASPLQNRLQDRLPMVVRVNRKVRLPCELDQARTFQTCLHILSHSNGRVLVLRPVEKLDTLNFYVLQVKPPGQTPSSHPGFSFPPTIPSHLVDRSPGMCPGPPPYRIDPDIGFSPLLISIWWSSRGIAR